MKRKSDEAQVRARGKQKDLLFHERPECCRVANAMRGIADGLKCTPCRSKVSISD